MVLSACATLQVDTDSARMDTDDTALTVMVPSADNIPGSFRTPPSSSSEQTSGMDYHSEDIPFILCLVRWSRYHDCLQPIFDPPSS